VNNSEQINLSSLKLVGDELVATIEQAAGKLEQYISDQTDDQLLRGCIDAIEQIGGTFQLLQLHGADLLTNEILSAARDINIEEEVSAELLSTLTSSFFILPRYFEYVKQTKQGMPILLIDYINELRQVRKQPTLDEDYYFDASVAATFTSSARFTSLTDPEFKPLVRRLRHMYQVGLLSLLQNKQPQSALGIMKRALERIEAISGTQPMAKLWWVATAAIEGIQADNMELNKPRKLLLSAVDKHLRQLQKTGLDYLHTEPSEAFIKRFVFLAALSASHTERIEDVLNTLDVQSLKYSDADLRHEREALKGPSANTVSSVVAVLNDELRLGKEILDRAGRACETGVFNDCDELIVTLNKVAEILAIVGLSSVANSLKEEIAKLQQYQENGTNISSDELIAVADVMLYVESSITNMDQQNLSNDSLHSANNTSRSEVIASAQLADAELVVIQEVEAGLALIKRALSSFVESEFDRGHVQNVGTTLDSVRGGMFVLQLSRAAAVVSACSLFIEDTLVQSTNEVALPQLLETFADAIIALEYYLEAVKEDKEADDSVLSLAEESLEAIGYAVG